MKGVNSQCLFQYVSISSLKSSSTCLQSQLLGKLRQEGLLSSGLAQEFEASMSRRGRPVSQQTNAQIPGKIFPVKHIGKRSVCSPSRNLNIPINQPWVLHCNTENMKTVQNVLHIIFSGLTEASRTLYLQQFTLPEHLYFIKDLVKKHKPCPKLTRLGTFM